MVSRGTIVYANVISPLEGHAVSLGTYLVTQQMVPAARIVAYYIVESEIVSSSFWFDVKDQCKTVLRLRISPFSLRAHKHEDHLPSLLAVHALSLTLLYFNCSAMMLALTHFAIFVSVRLRRNSAQNRFIEEIRTA